MGLKSGLAAQIGFADESTPGTPVAPTLFLPLIDESLGLEIDQLESDGIIAGRRVLDSDMWDLGGVTIGGDVGLELYNRGLTKLFKHTLGAVSTTGSGPYTHTITPGALDGTALTAQVGRPGVDGTVHPFTYRGCKVGSWELACKAGEIATFGLTLVGTGEEAGSRVVTDGATTNTDATVTSATAAFTDADIGLRVSGTGIPAGAYIASINSATSIELSAAATATGTGVSLTIGTALGSATLPAGLIPLHFKHGVLTIAGSTVKVKEATVAGDNGLAEDRRFLGQANVDEPLEADLRTYDGTLTAEFTDLTQYRRFLAGDEVALVLVFTAGADSVTITCNIRYDGETPKVSGKEILEQSLPIKCVGSTDADAITVVLVNSDSAA